MNTATYAPKVTAQEAYDREQAKLIANLERLLARAKVGIHAEGTKIHWGHVGDLNSLNTNIRRATDAVFKEGEHAE